MKKIITSIGYVCIAIAAISTWILSTVQTSSAIEPFSRDLFNLSIPTPPSWIGMVPYLGGLIEFGYSLFSLHGLAIVGIWAVCLVLAGICFSIGGDGHAKA